MTEDLFQIRHSNRQRKVNEHFKEGYQELKSNSNKKFTQKIEKAQIKKSQIAKPYYEYDYQTEWLDCLYPHDNGETFELKIQFCVLKPKKPLVKKQKKEQKEEGIMSLIQNLFKNLNQNPESVRKQQDQIQQVTQNKNGIVIHHPYFKKVEYIAKKQEDNESFEPTPETEELSEKFREIKRSFKPLILF